LSDIIIANKYEIIESTNKRDIVEGKFINSFMKNKNNLTLLFSEVAQSIENVKEIINPEKTYVAKFTKEVLEKINSGQYDMLKDKKGDILATLIDTTLPKNRNMIGQLRLDEIDLNIGEKVKKLSGNLTNIALQQQIGELVGTINEVKAIAVDIKKGQKFAILGDIKSGKEQLEQAMTLDDSDPNKKQLMFGAIQMLNKGRSTIELYISDELKKEIEIPNNKLKLLMKSLCDDKFYSNIETQFYEIQENMKRYFEATTLLALTYEIIDSKNAISEVIASAKELVGISYERMRELEQIAVSGKDRMQKDTWYSNPQVLIDEIDNVLKSGLKHDADCIQLEVSGRELLEGCNDE